MLRIVHKPIIIYRFLFVFHLDVYKYGLVFCRHQPGHRSRFVYGSCKAWVDVLFGGCDYAEILVL